MATHLKNLSISDLEPNDIFKKSVVAIVVSEWNMEITHSMYNAAFDFLIEMGLDKANIISDSVPGTFELPLGSQYYAKQPKVDAVIAIGCVIQGETRHFDFICDACANGLMNLGLQESKPIVFCVLTTETLEQAKDRSGGKHGNKGIEAAQTALKMILMKCKINPSK